MNDELKTLIESYEEFSTELEILSERVDSEMAYVFSDQILAKATITDEQDNKFTMQGINASESSADSIMGGMSTLLSIVGWGIKDAIRVINQDIEEVT